MSAAQENTVLSPPQGIDQSHLHDPWWHRHANPFSVLALGALLGAALLGTFGGQPHPTRTLEAPDVAIRTQFPEILRNGEFFEMRAMVTARRPFADMRIGVSQAYWHDLTINTMLPAPSQETSENGDFIFSYGPVETGQTLSVKFDGQINPPMFAGTEGQLKLMDGKETIVTMPVKLRVFP